MPVVDESAEGCGVPSLQVNPFNPSPNCCAAWGPNTATFPIIGTTAALWLKSSTQTKPQCAQSTVPSLVRFTTEPLSEGTKLPDKTAAGAPRAENSKMAGRQSFCAKAAHDEPAATKLKCMIDRKF